jgi:hypothetical protein
MIFQRVVTMFVAVVKAVGEFDRTDGSLALQGLLVSFDVIGSEPWIVWIGLHDSSLMISCSLKWTLGFGGDGSGSCTALTSIMEIVFSVRP